MDDQLNIACYYYVFIFSNVSGANSQVQVTRSDVETEHWDAIMGNNI